MPHKTVVAKWVFILAAALACMVNAAPAPAAALHAWDTVYSLVKDGGTLWAGNGIGIRRINLNSGESAQIVISQAFENKPRRMLRSGGSVWIARKYDIARCAADGTKCQVQDIRQRGEEILDAAADDDNAWLLLSGRVMRYDPALHLWQEFHAFQKKTSNREFRAMASAGNTLWLGEAKGNICALDKTTARLDCPLPFSRIPFHKWNGPLMATDTHLWFFHAGTLLCYSIKNNSVDTYRLPARAKDPGVINSILAGSDGAIWYSTHTTVGRFDPRQEKWTDRFPSSRGHSIHIAGRMDGNLIIITSHGLARLDPQRGAIKYFDLHGVLDSSYQPLAAALNNEVWLGFPSGKTVKFNPAANQPPKQTLPPCAPGDIIEKNLEGLEASRMSLPLTLEHLAVTRLEKQGALLWGASRYSVAMHDRAAGMWNVGAFDADTRFFLLDGGFVLATPEGRLLLCATDDAACTVPQRTIAMMDKSAHPPTAVLKYRDDLIVATREGRVLRFDLRKSAWKTILDIPERWRKLHPAHAALAGRSLWIARDNHLFRYQFAIGKYKIQHITSDKPLQGSEPLRLCAPQENTAVVVTDTHAHLFTGKSRVSAALPRSRGTLIATPCSHRDGVVWTAVSSLQSAPGALLRLDLKRKTVAATPFPRQDITVHDLEPDGDIIWLGTSAGVLRMSLGQDPPLLRPLGGE